MKREFLKELGIENKEVIDKIMAENGADIEKTKTKLEGERDNYKGQLETAQTALKEFEGVDVKDLQTKLTTLQNDLVAKETDYQNKLADMEFDTALNSAISSVKAKNAKSVKALLDLETLKSSKNQVDDIKKALEQIKSENDYLFESNEPIKNPVAPTGNPNITGLTKEMFAKMGYGERLKLKQSDPKKYDELKGE